MTWKISHEGPALCLSDHHVFLNGKYLDKVIELILSDVKASMWEFQEESIVLLSESMYGNVGTMAPHYTTYGPLPYQMTRKFEKLPCDGIELLSKQYTSKPMEVWE